MLMYLVILFTVGAEAVSMEKHQNVDDVSEGTCSYLQFGCVSVIVVHVEQFGNVNLFSIDAIFLFFARRY